MKYEKQKEKIKRILEKICQIKDLQLNLWKTFEKCKVKQNIMIKFLLCPKEIPLGIFGNI